jgi:methionyl-tRNA formyltransferase|tara:strand:- start:580 stop:969 length:390 start_codon:yes stop_codon:yes gene_type:complete
MEIPPKGCINFHSSLLPKYRGGSPIFWQLWFKDIVGVTIHFIYEKIDKGDIVLQSEVEVKRGDDIDSLHLRACEVGKKLMWQAIKKINDGTVIRKSQHNLEGSYYKDPTKEEEKLLGAKLLERWEENKE